MKTKEVLGKMVDAMSPDNWGQGHFSHRGRMCILGHLRAATSPKFYSERVSPSFQEQADYDNVAVILAKTVGVENSWYLTTFNDDPNTTFDDVFQIVKQAYFNELEA